MFLKIINLVYFPSYILIYYFLMKKLLIMNDSTYKDSLQSFKNFLRKDPSFQLLNYL